MNARDEDIESNKDRTYNFLWRFLLFIFIAGPASVFAFGIYGRLALKDSMAAALQRGDFMPMIVPVLWVIGLIWTGWIVFKR